MRMKFVILLLLFLQKSYSVNHMVEWIKRAADFNSDPCDNFYRHVCPVNISETLTIKNIIEQIYQNLENNKLPEVEDNMKIIFEKFVNSSSSENFQRGRLEFEKICTENRREADKLLKFLEDKFIYDEEWGCVKHYCFTTIAKDQNCTRGANTLINIFKKIFQEDSGVESLKMHSRSISKYYLMSYVVNTTFESLGLRKMEDLIDDIKSLALKRIKKTPWMIHSHSTESYKHLVRLLKYADKLYSDYNLHKNYVISINKSYKECMSSFATVPFIGKIVCTIDLFSHENQQLFLEAHFGAKNIHPNIYGSVPLYFISHMLTDYSAFMGLIGSIMAHEVGHSIIESPGIDNLMPYYSQETIDCIQDQFNTTCQYFKEDSCGINDDQIDENGADIFGNRIAYDLAFEHYGDSFYETVPELNITHQQLFFYAHALSFCNGELSRQKPGDRHSPLNIRINIVANLPEFQQAFQCSPDSKMVKSATKECIVIGENANHVKKV